MPKLHNNLDPIALNVYDAIFDGLQDHTPFVRIFGNRNCGYQELTNLQVAGVLAFDQTALITNWYARTNIAPCEQLDEWAHSTIATLNVGHHPVALLNLYDLLRRPQGAFLPEEVVTDTTMLDMSITRRALAAYNRSTGARTGLFDLSERDRNAWTAVGEEMRRLFKGPPTIVVPVRQDFSVSIDGSSQALEKLRLYMALLPLTKGTSPLPKPRAWIHLEGVSFHA